MGNMLEEMERDTSGQFKYNHSYKYNDNGLYSEVTGFKEDFGQFTCCKYKYNSNNKLTELVYNGYYPDNYGYYGEVTYNPDNYIRQYEYDNKNRLVKETVKNIPSNEKEIELEPDITIFEYNETENEKTILETDDSNHELSTHDKDGMLTHVEFYYHEYKKPQRTDKYTYEFY